MKLTHTQKRNKKAEVLFSTVAGITALTAFSSCIFKNKKVLDQKPLNIVYIMTDDYTAQMMSCYETRYIETPNLDRIATDGNALLKIQGSGASNFPRGHRFQSTCMPHPWTYGQSHRQEYDYSRTHGCHIVSPR